MKKRLTIFIFAAVMGLSACSVKEEAAVTTTEATTTETTTTTTVATTQAPSETVSVVEKTTLVVEPATTRMSTTKIDKTEGVTEEDIKLLALVTMAEAEAEPELGKRLVIDTILNRVDSKKFPNTIKGVIYQRSQFTSMTNGRVDRCEVREDIVQLVREELESRTNYHVIYFRTGHYHPYGTPMFSIGNHYFSEV